MSWIINILNSALDLFYLPFSGLSPFWGLLAMSAVTGVVMVIIYKYTSNQKGIARAKDLIKGHLLETWIYREQVGVMLRAQKKVLWNNFRYMGLALKPLAVMMIPVLLILINMNFRYGMKPIEPGGVAVVRATRPQAVPIEDMDESLEVPDGVTVETPAVRIESQGETYWRVRLNNPGKYIMKITAGGQTYEKSIESGLQGTRIVPLRSASVIDNIFYPGEPSMSSTGPLKSIDVSYATESPAIPGTKWRLNWLIQYFVLSIIFGFAVKGPFKVEI